MLHASLVFYQTCVRRTFGIARMAVIFVRGSPLHHGRQLVRLWYCLALARCSRGNLKQQGARHVLVHRNTFLFPTRRGWLLSSLGSRGGTARSRCLRRHCVRLLCHTPIKSKTRLFSVFQLIFRENTSYATTLEGQGRRLEDDAT